MHSHNKLRVQPSVPVDGGSVSSSAGRGEVSGRAAAVWRRGLELHHQRLSWYCAVHDITSKPTRWYRYVRSRCVAVVHVCRIVCLLWHRHAWVTCTTNGSLNLPPTNHLPRGLALKPHPLPCRSPVSPRVWSTRPHRHRRSVFSPCPTPTAPRVSLARLRHLTSPPPPRPLTRVKIPYLTFGDILAHLRRCQQPGWTTHPKEAIATPRQ